MVYMSHNAGVMTLDSYTTTWSIKSSLRNFSDTMSLCMQPGMLLLSCTMLIEEHFALQTISCFDTSGMLVAFKQSCPQLL